MENAKEKKAIICVDDEKYILKSLQHELEHAFGAEYLVESASGSKEALEIIEDLLSDSYELVVAVVDYIMPNMKGDKLLEIIHQRSPDTRNIMLTGMATTEGIQYAVNKANLYRFMTKPWNHNDIVMTINEAIKSYDMKIALTQKQKELQKANEKLMRLDISKTYFLSLLSHELNTPLIGIDGYLQLLRASLSDEEQIEFCELIAGSAQKLKLFSEYSLFITRLLNQKYQLRKMEFEINSIVNDAIMYLGASIKEKDIQIENNICNEKSLYIDPDLTERVIKIILSNAIKFTPSGSTITIADKESSDKYTIEITDEGPGFAKETLDILFEFFVSDEIMNHQEGFGLGLAMSKIIMDVQGGSILAENTKEAGARVSLEIQNNQTDVNR